jgi:hypothetical protein
MQYKNTSLVIFIYFLIIGAAAGCKKFVQIDPPNDRIVTASVFNNANAATAAVVSIYTQMAAESYSMSLNCGLLSDELKNYSNASSMIGYYTNSMSSMGTPATLWNSAYNYIYRANAIIEGLQNNKDIDKTINYQLAGEAKFIRAYWYFYLTNCYGDVPLVTSTDYTVNSQLARTARSAVYQQIIKDLEEAEGMLNSQFVDQSDTTTTIDRVRPTKWAATALLARTYLYTGDYTKAEMKATEVINNSSVFSLEQDLSKVFLANSTETIWQLGVFPPTVTNTLDGYAFILKAAPRNNGNSNISAISSELLNAFESGDHRKTDWIGAFSTTDAPVVTYYFPFKYKVYQTINNSITEYTMMLRLAEQYLIRAESRVQLEDDPASVLADLDTLRHRAGLPSYSAGTDEQSLLNAILHERQVELFAEWGHRWFDLIRTNKANSVMSIVAPLKGGNWSPNWQLFPIPQDERVKDTHLSQNNGYN